MLSCALLGDTACSAASFAPDALAVCRCPVESVRGEAAESGRGGWRRGGRSRPWSALWRGRRRRWTRKGGWGGRPCQPPWRASAAAAAAPAPASQPPAVAARLRCPALQLRPTQQQAAALPAALAQHRAWWGACSWQRWSRPEKGWGPRCSGQAAAGVVFAGGGEARVELPPALGVVERREGRGLARVRERRPPRRHGGR